MHLSTEKASFFMRALMSSHPLWGEYRQKGTAPPVTSGTLTRLLGVRLWGWNLLSGTACSAELTLRGLLCSVLLLEWSLEGRIGAGGVGFGSPLLHRHAGHSL